jgi:hypothetical protein
LISGWRDRRADPPVRVVVPAGDPAVARERLP